MSFGREWTWGKPAIVRSPVVVTPAPLLERQITVSRTRQTWTWSAMVFRRYHLFGGIAESLKILASCAGLAGSREEAWEAAREAGAALAPANAPAEIR